MSFPNYPKYGDEDSRMSIPSTPSDQPKSVNSAKKPASQTLETLKQWLTNNKLTTEEAFNKLCIVGIGSSKASDKFRLSEEDFFTAIKSLGLNLKPSEIVDLFTLFDQNNDGLIDIEEWKRVFPGKTKMTIKEFLQKNVKKRNIKKQEILKQMEISQNETNLSGGRLKYALKCLDKTLNEEQYNQLVEQLLNGQDKISAVELCSKLGIPVDHYGKIDDEWVGTCLKLLKLQIKGGEVSPEELRRHLYSYDTTSTGFITPVDFITCLNKVQFKMNPKDMSTLADAFTQGIAKVNYKVFLKGLGAADPLKIGNKPFDQPHKFAEALANKIKEFMREQNILSESVFLQYVKNPIAPVPSQEDQQKQKSPTVIVPKGKFSEFLLSKKLLLKKSDQNEAYAAATMIDIDSDGMVSNTDLQIFLKRYLYMDDKLSVMSGNRSQGSFGVVRKRTPFPKKKKLSSERAQEIIQKIKEQLSKRGMTPYDLFKCFDLDYDGVITFEEFCTGLEYFLQIKLSEAEGLFNYIDRRGMGLISYENLNSAMQQEVTGVFNKMAAVAMADDFTWEENTLKQIKKFCRQETLSTRDAFRLMDCDFDGEISASDLEQFLIQTLHIYPSQISASRVSRLLKLMDQYKRGKVMLNDFKRIIVEETTDNANLPLTGGKFIKNTSTTEWKLHAKQQIGLYIDTHYAFLEKAYSDATKDNDKLTSGEFIQWIQKNNVLNDFNLNKELLLELFAYLDPHKKGFLTLLDWKNAFHGYKLKNQVFNELREMMYTHFGDMKSAFKFFQNFVDNKLYGTLILNKEDNEITFEAFKNAILAIVPKRYSLSDIIKLWNEISNQTTTLKESDFIKTFQSGKIPLPRPATTKNQAKVKKADFQDYKESKQTENFRNTALFDKLKMLLRASKRTLEQIFREYDKDNSGKLSISEFREALRHMNLGLTSNEIDTIIFQCDKDADGSVDWIEFASKFKLNENHIRLLNRSMQKLREIKSKINLYLVSPKDAFMQYGADKKDQMSFERFYSFMQKLYGVAKEPLPSIAIFKDLFEVIDVRQDGLIDINEWVQTLNSVHVTEKNNVVQPQKKPRSESSKEITQSVNTWEQSREYNDIMRAIGRNRKFLAQKFEEMKNSKTAISYDRVKNLLTEINEAANIKLTDNQYRQLIMFASKNSEIDTTHMLNVFRDKLNQTLKA